MKSTTVVKILPEIPGLDLNNISNPVNSGTSGKTENSSSAGSEPTQTNTGTSTKPVKHRVIYQAEDNGSFATYNPSYILRKTVEGIEFEIRLPSKSGTLALLSDIDERPLPDNVITKEKLQQCLNKVVKDDFPVENYTISQLVDSYNGLIQALRDLIKE